MEISNTWYDRLKVLVQVVLPGLAALYVGLAQFWDLPKATEVAGSIALLAVFLGLFLNRSATKYEGAGDLILHKDLKDGQVYLSADWNDHPDKFKDGQNVTMNVRREDIVA